MRLGCTVPIRNKSFNYYEGVRKMYVILVYDINQKRVGKALKICRKYLIHIQKSVFEGNITESKLSALKEEMNNLIDTQIDSVIIYRLDSVRYTKKEQIGIVQSTSNII